MANTPAKKDKSKNSPPPPIGPFVRDSIVLSPNAIVKVWELDGTYIGERPLGQFSWIKVRADQTPGEIGKGVGMLAVVDWEYPDNSSKWLESVNFFEISSEKKATGAVKKILQAVMGIISAIRK